MKKFSGLELCRAVCALAVIVWHYQHFLVTGLAVNNFAELGSKTLPMYNILSPFYQHGYIAVSVFWVLSGFIFFWKYSEAIFERSMTYKSFIVLRFSRLYPLHLITLIGVAILQALYIHMNGEPFIYGHNSPLNFVLQLVFASNWLRSQPFTFNGPIWSISTEIFTYFVFIFLLRLVKPGIFLCISVVALSELSFSFDAEPLTNCILLFFMGGLIEKTILLLRPIHRRAVFWFSMFVVFFIIRTGLEDKSHLLIVIFASSLVCAASLANLTCLGRLDAIGHLTYSSYLIHFPIQLAAMIFVKYLGLDKSLFLSPYSLLAFLTTTFTLAWLVYNGFELPVQNFIRRAWLPRS